jgi:hypothetical protein
MSILNQMYTIERNVFLIEPVTCRIGVNGCFQSRFPSNEFSENFPAMKLLAYQVVDICGVFSGRAAVQRSRDAGLEYNDDNRFIGGVNQLPAKFRPVNLLGHCFSRGQHGFLCTVIEYDRHGP